ncbi:MAG: translocation/assembly module TamB domain-containing protein, partial [Spirochaetaceae bacterium]|nr:translocation/assembly module TamB domain-containing protein [Spirochaetaceae bacterium]
MRTKRNYFYYTAAHFLFFLLLAALTFFVLKPLQQTLRERMIVLRDYIITQAEGFFGFRIEYASIGPSLFGFLDLKDVRIWEDSGDPLPSRYPLISISRLRVSYSLFTILKGEIPASVRGIYLDRPLVSLDARNLEKYRDIAARLQGKGKNAGRAGESGETGDWAALLPGELMVRVRRGECTVRLGENNASLRGLNFDTRIADDKIDLRGKWIAGLSLGYFSGQDFAVAMAGRVSGEYDLAGRRGNITLNIPSAAGENFNIRAVNFGVLLDNEGLSVRKLADRSPYSLSLDYVFASGRVSGEFRADNFSPREIMVLSGAQRDYNRYLALTATGSASFEADGEGGLGYRVDLSGGLGRNFPPGLSNYVINGSGNEKRVHFDELLLGFTHGSLSYSGDLEYNPLEPNGVITVSDFSVSGDGALNGKLAVSGSGDRIDIFSDSFSLGKVFLSALDLEFSRGENGLSFALSALRFRDVESWENVSLSEISLDGTLNYSPLELQTSLGFDSFSVMDILEITRPFGKIPLFPAPVTAAAGGTSISTEIFITTDFSQISYNVPQLVIAYQGRGELLALISLSGTDRRFEISEGSIAWPGGGSNITGSADFSNIDDVSFSLRASWQEQTYYLEGLFLDQNSLSVTGSYGLSAYAVVNPFGGFSAYFEVDSIPIPINDQFARFSTFISVRYDNPDSWYADLDRFEVDDLATPVSLSSSVRLSGIADQEGAQFRDLYFDDGRGALWGEANFSWNHEPGENPPQYLGNIRMETQRGEEYYDVSGTYDGGTLGLTLKGERVQLDRFFRNAMGATVTGEGRFDLDSAGDWSMTAVVGALAARNGDTELVLSASASMNPDELNIRNLHAAYGTVEAELPVLTVNRADTVAHTDARIWGTAAGRSMELSFNARVEFLPADSWFRMNRALDSFTGVISVGYARFDALENQDPFELEFSRTEAGFALDGGPRNMIRAVLSEDGSFFASLSQPSPVRGTVTGVLSSRTIDAQAQDLYVDMVSLWSVIPSNPIINCTGGFVNASIRIRGPLGDPEFFGFAQGNSIRLSIPLYLNAEIGPVPILVTLDGNEMRFGPVNAPCGKGYGEVSGWFRFDRWIPDTLNISIDAAASTPIPFSFDVLGILAAGNASGTLDIDLANQSLRVTGNLTGEDTEITLNTQEMVAAGSSPEGGEDSLPVATDFTIKTGRKVEFLWPNANTPILRANAAAGTAIRIASDSVSGRYSLNGDVNLRSGEIYYLQRSFYIRDGALAFNENELQFDPRLTVRAEIRDRTDDGPVTISMIVENEPLLSFEARFESSPPLSQVDILSLLGQNVTDESQEEGEAVNLMLS